MTTPEHRRAHPLGTILLAADFSPTARIAQAWAIELARLHRARLQVIHAIDEDALPLVHPDEEQLVEQIRRRLAAIVAEAEGAGVSASGTHEFGRSWEVVVTAAETLEADLVVLGSRGQTVLERIFLGSTADRVLRSVPLPVLIVHPPDADRPPRFETILVGVDFSDESALAVQTARRLIVEGAGAGRIVLLHACHMPLALSGLEPPIPAALERGRLEQEARSRLEDIAARIRTESLIVDVRVHQAYGVDAILREASISKPDVIAVGMHGRSRLNRLFMGSVAERVVHLAPCPVLTVQARERD